MACILAEDWQAGEALSPLLALPLVVRLPTRPLSAPPCQQSTPPRSLRYAPLITGTNLTPAAAPRAMKGEGRPRFRSPLAITTNEPHKAVFTLQ